MAAGSCNRSSCGRGKVPICLVLGRSVQRRSYVGSCAVRICFSRDIMQIVGVSILFQSPGRMGAAFPCRRWDETPNALKVRLQSG